MSRILIVDDELSMREMLEIFFQHENHEVMTASDGLKAIQILTEEEFDLIITDLRMPKTHGLVVLERAKVLYPDTPVIIMTAYATADTAVKAMKMGAYDYFTKPFHLDQVRTVIDKALERRDLVLENRALRAELDGKNQTGEMVGPQMKKIFSLIRRIAPTRSSVLILGESGTGKELVANAIHEYSDRQHKPFFVINCAAIPETLLESELFGHRKGTFTGASVDRVGLFQAADGGSLFLDEIGEMPLSMQVKLLRVLQAKRVKRVGDLKEQAVDVRLLAATNKNLEAEVRNGKFREDLFYRLNVISIELPPLRERPSDIPLLAQHFLNRYSKEFKKQIPEFSPEVMRSLLSYSFTGNIRELANIIERAVALEDTDRITVESLPPSLKLKRVSAEKRGQEEIFHFPEEGIDLEERVEQMKREFIAEALRRTGGKKKKAAELLGISFRALRYLLSKHKT